MQQLFASNTPTVKWYSSTGDASPLSRISFRKSNNLELLTMVTFHSLHNRHSPVTKVTNDCWETSINWVRPVMAASTKKSQQSMTSAAKQILLAASEQKLHVHEPDIGQIMELPSSKIWKLDAHYWCSAANIDWVRLNKGSDVHQRCPTLDPRLSFQSM